jgi:hypothetical protein
MRVARVVLGPALLRALLWRVSDLPVVRAQPHLNAVQIKHPA